MRKTLFLEFLNLTQIDGLGLSQVFISYEELLKYRAGAFDIAARIENIPDSGTRDMVTHMVALNPRERLRASESQ